MKTAISIPDAVYKEAAQRLSMSRSELYTKAVRAFLDDLDDGWITEALDEVYAEEPSTLDKALAAMQTASLPEDAW